MDLNIYVTTGTGTSQEDKKTKKKTRPTVDNIPTTTDVLLNHCSYRNHNQPNIVSIQEWEIVFDK